MSSKETASGAGRAVLVGIQLPGMSDAELESSLDEMERLAKTLGLEVIGRLTQQRSSGSATTVLGTGKLRELGHWTGGTGVVPAGVQKRQKGAKPAEADDDEGEVAEADGLGDADPVDAAGHSPLTPALSPEGRGRSRGTEPPRASVVLFDQDLSPSQLRNLEGATDAQVLDRSSVILSIFERHARTEEARLQVELARLIYLAPRLRATGGGERQRGGIGGKGAGESALELDRRRVRDRIAEVRQELVVVQRESQMRRARRVNHDTVALVGYTNAGKSSLMRGLTQSEVLVKDQLFATLDTTVRALQPETRPRILVSDTVGFIKKLPHDLVASFRSTLEEARAAALLVHVVDASDPAWRSQFEVTKSVLRELDAGDSPSLVVLNKADRLEPAQRAELALEMPDAELMSAFNRTDLERLHRRIVAFFERGMVDATLFVPYAQGRLVHTIHEACRVLATEHGEHGTELRVRAPQPVIDELKAALSESAA